MQHSRWPEKTCSANLNVPRRNTAFKWPTSSQSNSLYSTSQVGNWHTEDWHEDSRSLSAFLSLIREYLDPVIKDDQCAQFVDDTGIAANTPHQLIKNLRAVFQCPQKAGFKLSMAKCHFGVQEVYFVGRTIKTKGDAPQKQKIAKFLEKVKFPRSKKALQRYIVFLNYYQNYISRLAERLTPFF